MLKKLRTAEAQGKVPGSYKKKSVCFDNFWYRL